MEPIDRAPRPGYLTITIYPFDFLHYFRHTLIRPSYTVITDFSFNTDSSFSQTRNQEDDPSALNSKQSIFRVASAWVRMPKLYPFF